MQIRQFHLGTVRIQFGWSVGQIRQSGYPRSDEPHIPNHTIAYIAKKVPWDQKVVAILRKMIYFQIEICFTGLMH